MIVNSRENRGFKFEVLTRDELEQIHNATLHIMAKVGIKIHNENALRLLEDNGARIEDKIAYIPEWLVEEAIRTSPGRVTLYSTDRKQKIYCEKNNLYFGLGTEQPSYIDPYTQEVRPAVLKDVENIAKVAQEADNMDFVACLALPSDVPQELTELYTYKEMRKHCTKPLLSTVQNPENLKALLDMAAASVGGHEELKKYPSMYLYGEPVSPLMISEEAVGNLMVCAEYGIPFTLSSGVMAGATGPQTFAGAIAVGNAENLAGLVIHQLTAKGAPFIYGMSLGAIDMKTSIDVYGGPEVPTVQAIIGQLSRYYNLPSFGLSGATDSNIVDVQAGMESMFSNVLAALGGTNLTHDNGYMGAGLIACLEKILLDDEVISYVKKFAEGIQVNEETLALDLIEECGHGGEYLTNEHTFKHYEKELWYPNFLNKKQQPAWEAEGKPTVNDKLTKRAIEIIERDEKIKLTDEKINTLDSIILKRKNELGL